jgi:hypothetical protein
LKQEIQYCSSDLRSDDPVMASKKKFQWRYNNPSLRRSRNRSLTCAQVHTPTFPLLLVPHLLTISVTTTHRMIIMLFYPCFDAANDGDDPMKCLDCKATPSPTCQAYRTADSENNCGDLDCMRYDGGARLYPHVASSVQRLPPLPRHASQA